MTELLTREMLTAVGAAIAAVVAIGLAIVITQRAVTRAAAAERRLNALYAEIETAIGNRIDRSAGGRWRDQLSAELRKLVSSSARAGPGDVATDWIPTAVRALAAAARSVERLAPDSESGRIATALGLAGRLAESRQAVEAVASVTELEDALVAGALNDVLTTAPLIARYFSHDAGLALAVEAYRLAAAALRLALAEADIVVDTPAVLSIVSRREARGEGFDVRELRRIPQAKALASRVADRLAPGEHLIVYCSAPGWTKHDGQRPPALVFWNDASWLA